MDRIILSNAFCMRPRLVESSGTRLAALLLAALLPLVELAWDVLPVPRPRGSAMVLLSVRLCVCLASCAATISLSCLSMTNSAAVSPNWLSCEYPAADMDVPVVSREQLPM